MLLNPADFPDDYRLCAVCGRPLDGVFGAYEHLQDRDKDHVPVPVLVGELPWAVMRCDFCNEDVDEGGWVLPADDFWTSPISESVGDWSVCGRCLADVRRHRWTALASRAVSASSAAAGAVRGGDGPALRKELLRVYRLLDVHITGVPYPAVATPPMLPKA